MVFLLARYKEQQTVDEQGLTAGISQDKDCRHKHILLDRKRLFGTIATAVLLVMGHGLAAQFSTRCWPDPIP